MKKTIHARPPKWIVRATCRLSGPAPVPNLAATAGACSSPVTSASGGDEHGDEVGQQLQCVVGGEAFVRRAAAGQVLHGGGQGVGKHIQARSAPVVATGPVANSSTKKISPLISHSRSKLKCHQRASPIECRKPGMPTCPGKATEVVLGGPDRAGVVCPSDRLGLDPAGATTRYRACSKSRGRGADDPQGSASPRE